MKIKWTESSLIILICLFVLLQLGVEFSWLDSRFFPKPSDVFKNIFELITSHPTFMNHVLASAERFVLALLPAVFLSVSLSLLAGLNKKLLNFLNTLNGLIYPLPKSALYPFVLLGFGLAGTGQIFLIFLGICSSLLLILLPGYNRLESLNYLSLARILNLKKIQLITKIFVPGLLPEFFQGLKLALSQGLVLLVVSEMIGTKFGIGVFLWSAWDQFNILNLYSVFYIIAFTGLGIFKIFGALAEKASNSQMSL